jgi:hypothetical protein
MALSRRDGPARVVVSGAASVATSLRLPTLRLHDPPMPQHETDPGFTSVPIDELPTIWDGWAKLVRAGLGITAFGVQIMDFPPNHTTRSHDEASSGQEELYLALRGSGEILIGPDGEHLPLDTEHVARIGPGVDRSVVAGPEGLRMLCVGGVPGAPYTPPEWTSPEG